MKHFIYLLLSVVAALPIKAQTDGFNQITADANGRVYVDNTKSGTGDSWDNAAAELADALKAAETRGIAEIWVAAGTYTPKYIAGDGTGVRDQAFVLVNNVKIYGGFAGGETSTEARVPGTNQTILSGDIGTPNDNSDNCYHVVISAGNVGTATLDGITITGGNADNIYSAVITVNDQPCFAVSGGGMYNTSSSPTLTNVTISRNTAHNGGGMFNNSSSSPTLTNVTISGNTAADSGGGMYNNYFSSPILTNVTISGNTAHNGGGMYNLLSSSPTLTNVTISENKATYDGGGMYNDDSSSPILTNVTISGNTAIHGGGMFNYSSSPTLTNVTISGNEAAYGGGMYNWGFSPQIRNSIILGEVYNDGSSPTYTHSLVEGATTPAGEGNINGDPLFVNAAEGDFRLSFGSPCIDAGSDTYYESGKTLDLAGKPRFIGTIDMGAYENQDLKNVGTNTNLVLKGEWHQEAYTAIYETIVPAHVTSIDFTEVDGITDAMPEMINNLNPNCLVYLPQDGGVINWKNTNRIIGGVAGGDIVLEDGYPFYAPKAFNVSGGFTISYTRDFTDNFATRFNGWNTLCVPFEAQMMVEDMAKTPFVSDEDTWGDFWLKTFSGGTGDEVSFDHTQTIQPYTPYLIALPGEVFGTASMDGSSVRFIAVRNDITVFATPTVAELRHAPAGSDFEYVCSFDSLRSEDIYILLRGEGEERDVFACPPSNATAGVLPFRAYIKAAGPNGGNESRARMLSIVNEDGTTGIGSIALSEEDAARRDAKKPYKVMTRDGIRIVAGDRVYTIEGTLIGDEQ